jgi:hypothetical protein
MYPDETLQMVADRVTIALKASSSEPDMDKRIGKDIRKHIQKLKKMAKTKEVEAKLAPKTLEEQAANQKAQELAQQKAQVEQEKQQIGQQSLDNFRPAGGRATRVRKVQMKDWAIAEKTKEVEDTDQKFKEAQALARKKEQEKQSLTAAKQKAEQAQNVLNKKKSKRNDVAQLEVIVTPRQKAKDSPSWNPPRLNGRTYDAPDNNWEDESIRKLGLLTNLRNHLASKHLVPQTTTFVMVMEMLGILGITQIPRSMTVCFSILSFYCFGKPSFSLTSQIANRF